MPFPKIARITGTGALLPVSAFALPWLLGLRKSELLLAGFFLTAISIAIALQKRYPLDDGTSRYSHQTLLNLTIETMTLSLGVLAGLTILMCAINTQFSPTGFFLTDELGLLNSGNLSQGDFAPFSATFPHNLGVLATLCVLSAVYGVYGFSFAITWNLSVWSMVLVPVVDRTLDVYPTAVMRVLLVSVAAIAPHLVLELLSYVLGGIASILVARSLVAGVTGKSFSFNRMKSAWLGLAISAPVLAVASLSESHLAAYILKLLPHSI